MPTLNVYWRAIKFDAEQQSKVAEDVRTGLLTTEHEGATEDMPVLLEDRSQRVYRAADLPPDTVLYAEAAPGGLPPLAERSVQAGFHVRRADEDANR